ncbi:MAG: hypothetical protein PVH41_03080 [Anaerolineae bacterium]|jgi:hypothetical protein
MAFDLERLFVDVFAPAPGEVVTMLYDLPHGELSDHEAWRERRAMAEDWHWQIVAFSVDYGMWVNPVVTYQATGSHNANMPESGMCEGKRVRLEDTIGESTIVISMPQYSASAPLLGLTRKYEKLRAASMPLVARAMEETGLSADYRQVAAACDRIAPGFERAEAVEVIFSTGHTCTFDLSDHKPVLKDNGQLHPGAASSDFRLANLPAGEVCTVPNEAGDSRTAGEIPAVSGDETVVFVVRHNQIVDVGGDGPVAKRMRCAFRDEPAMRNIAEVAIGCNDKAVVTGNPLEDEKAGFHWAYGRSEHIGGTVGPDDFSSPDKVVHYDIVYAKGNPVVCAQLDFVNPDGTRATAIKDGVLIV